MLTIATCVLSLKTYIRSIALVSIATSLALYTNVINICPGTCQETPKPGEIWSQVDNYLSEITKNGIMRWTNDSMPLHVYISNAGITGGYRPEFITMLQQAFSEWSSISQNHISFLFTNNPDKAKITCDWTSDPKEMTTLTEGGHALIIPDDHNIKLVHITFLTQSPNSQPLSDQYFKRLALHEIGHALGLAHSLNSNDIMYGTANSPMPNCSLTNRDKNTLVALYSIDKNKINSTAINVASMLPEKTNQSDLARIIRLNAEAAEANKNKNLALAVSKLEEAHKIDAKNDLVNCNLGAAYGNCAIIAAFIKDNQKAQAYFDKSLGLLSKSSNKQSYLSVLSSYEGFLRCNQRTAEAERIAGRIKALAAK